MIRLDLKCQPHWLDLGHGVRLHVRPCTTALVMAARAATAREARVLPNDEAAGTLTAAFVKKLARLAVEQWEGVGDADGAPAAVTPEGVDALLDLWPIADAFERQYLGPALLLEEEKNG
jgi:hypothetical protein